MDGPQNPNSRVISGGEKGIRTPGTLARSPDFESGTFGLSVISPPRNLFDRPHPCQGDTAHRRAFPSWSRSREQAFHQRWPLAGGRRGTVPGSARSIRFARPPPRLWRRAAAPGHAPSPFEQALSAVSSREGPRPAKGA